MRYGGDLGVGWESQSMSRVELYRSPFLYFLIFLIFSNISNIF